MFTLSYFALYLWGWDMTRKAAIAKFIEILDAIEFDKRYMSFWAQGKPLADGNIFLAVKVEETLQ